MNGKYKIVSASNIVNMIVDFQDESGITKTVHVGVDYLMEKIYFLDKSDEHTDYNELEKTILQSIRPEECELPEIDPDIMLKVNEIREGKFDNQNILNDLE